MERTNASDHPPPKKPPGRLLGTRGVLAIVFILVASFASFLWLEERLTPTYRGESVHVWAKRLAEETASVRSEKTTDPEARLQAAKALRALGDRAIPYLLQELQAAPPRWQHLRQRLAEKSPSYLAQWILPPPESRRDRIRRAEEALYAMGGHARAAIPELTSWLSLPNKRYAAAHTLGLIGPEAVPTLLRQLTATDLYTRNAAAIALQYCSPFADSAILQLLKLLDLRPDEPIGWSDRSIAETNAQDLSRAASSDPPYPQLARVIRHADHAALSAAIAQVLKQHSKESIEASAAHQATLAFRRLWRETRPLLENNPSEESLTQVLTTLDQAIHAHPTRAFAIGLIKLELALAHQRIDQAESTAKHLYSLTSDRWRRHYELADTLCQNTTLTEPIETLATQAGARAYELSHRTNILAASTLQWVLMTLPHEYPEEEVIAVSTQLTTLVQTNPFYLPARTRNKSAPARPTSQP